MRIRSVMRPRYGKGGRVAIDRAIGCRLSPADTGVIGQNEASVLSWSSQQRLTEDCDMARVLFVVFGGLAYLIFFATFLYLRSEEHTSELQSLMRTSYAVFCLKKKK